MVEVQDLAADEVGRLADSPQAGRIEDDRKPRGVGLDLVGPANRRQAVEEVIAVVNVIVDDHDGILPLRFQPVP